MQLKGLALFALSLSPAALLAGRSASPAHEVKMVQVGKTYRFDPATITIKSGEAVTFTVASGGPHNVAFAGDSLPADVKAALTADMPDQIAPLAGPLLATPGKSYTITFAKIKPGTYSFFCMPHMAFGMKGTLTVQ